MHISMRNPVLTIAFLRPCRLPASAPSDKQIGWQHRTNELRIDLLAGKRQLRFEKMRPIVRD
jgi:hypothetical protein